MKGACEQSEGGSRRGSSERRESETAKRNASHADRRSVLALAANPILEVRTPELRVQVRIAPRSLQEGCSPAKRATKEKSRRLGLAQLEHMGSVRRVRAELEGCIELSLRKSLIQSVDFERG